LPLYGLALPLELEWRVASGENSGIPYRVSEALPQAWQSVLAMQLLDDARHPDDQMPETSAGVLYYGLIAHWQKVLRPMG
jgi:3-keto-disaccharide hydrolase